MARLALGLTAALLLAGCGGDDDAPVKATTATAQQSALRTHMLVEGDIDGIDPVEPVRVTNPEDWITDSGHVDADQVRASGFVEGMRQQITAGAGMNLAARFKTAAQAQAESEFELPPVPDIKIQRFEVPGVPGAIGRTATGHETGYSVTFATDDVWHLIASKKSGASRADVIAATQRLYQRLK